VFHGFGFRSRLRIADWAIVGIMVQLTTCCLVEAAIEALSGGPLDTRSWIVIAGHSIGCVLFLEAVRLRKAAQSIRGGLVSRVWMALIWGVLLTGFGDIVLWVIPHVTQSWPMAIIESLVRIPAAGAFALAPAYLLAAQRRAVRPVASPEAEPVSGVPIHGLS
jgi:hypothetical protein